MKRAIPVLVLCLLAALLSLAPLYGALADTSLATELISNGGAETGAAGSISGWTDETGASRWSSGGVYSDWAPPVEGSRYFFFYNPSFDELTGTMSQWVNLSGSEGSGLFSQISAGDIAMSINLSMHQNLSTGNQASIIIEEYSASNTLLKTSTIANTTVGTGVFGAYNFNTQLQSGTRKFKVKLDAILTRNGYVQFDRVSLKLISAAAGSPPEFGEDFPADGSTASGTAYTHGFTVTDPDAGDIDRLTFSASSTNVELVPVSRVVVTGSGTSRTLTITPISGLSGESIITVIASDGVKTAEKALHLVVSKVISLGTNLVENSNATSGYASWSGSNVNVTATGNGFRVAGSGNGMYQYLDISKYAAVIDGGLTEFEFKASEIVGSGGWIDLQFYSDIACTTPVGSKITRTNNTAFTGTIPATAKGAIVAFTISTGTYFDVTFRNISVIILNTFPKMAAIAAQTTKLEALTVPVSVYYTAASATLTATSDDQTIVTNGGITAGGSGFERTLTFTPLKEGTVTITATVNDGTASASRTFSVTVHEPAVVESVDEPAAGYYAAGGHLDYTVHFNRDIQGGTGSVLPLTVGGTGVDAAYLSATADSITYRYTLNSSDEGAVGMGDAIDDTGSPITDSSSAAATLTLPAGASAITAIPEPEVSSNAAGDTATYGTQVTFTLTLSCSDTLSGTVQFQADGVDIGSPVALSGNQASYQTSATTLGAGSPSITANYLPTGAAYHFTSLTSNACDMTINPKPLTVTGLVAAPRVYDGTTDVSVTGGALSGILVGDTVSATYPTAGTAVSKNAGTRSVSFASVTLTGVDKDHYSIPTQPTVTVIISPKPITFSATAQNKVYDGNTTATVASVMFDGLASPDTLTLTTDYTASGVYDSAAIGDDIPVTVTVSLTGSVAATNYTLSATTAETTADITRKGLTLTGVSAPSRAYDGSTVVELTGGTLEGVAAADAGNVSFTLGEGETANANAGDDKPVTTAITLTGSAADAYTLTQPTYVTVDIAKVDVTLTTVEAEDKAYDGNASATVTDVGISGEIDGETLVFGTDYTATGAFDSASVGTDKTVTVTVTLADTATARNYALPDNTVQTQASITNSGVTITGVTATDRAYDGTDSVDLTGGTLVGIAPEDVADVAFSLNTGTVASATAGDGKPVTTAITLTGSKAGNYTLTQPTDITVTIAKAALTITTATIADKTYDATADATVTEVFFDGLVSGETMTLGVDYTASGVFDSADAGMPIDVTVTVTLGGTATAANYGVAGSGTVASAIMPCELTGSVTIDVTNGPGDPILLDEGDVLAVNVSGVTVPGTLTYACQWYRDGAEITGETGNTYTVGNLTTDPVGTSFTVVVMGTDNYINSLESEPATVVDIPLGGTLTIDGDTRKGSVLTLNTDALTPASATYDIAWLCDGTAIAGECAAIHTIAKADQDTTLTVEVQGTGYFSGLLTASIDIPPSPYVPDTGFTEFADMVTVDLTLGSTLLSPEQLDELLAYNAAKPVVFGGDGYTITFPVGAMTACTSDLNLGVRFNEGTGYTAIVAGSGDSFVMMLEFLHSGALPGEAQVTIDVGVDYAGQTLRYLYYNTETGKLELVQTALVDALGHMTVTQDHCSSYGVARLIRGVPETGDNTPLLLWWALVGACAAGLLALLIRYLMKRKART